MTAPEAEVPKPTGFVRSTTLIGLSLAAIVGATLAFKQGLALGSIYLASAAAVGLWHKPFQRWYMTKKHDRQEPSVEALVALSKKPLDQRRIRALCEYRRAIIAGKIKVYCVPKHGRAYLLSSRQLDIFRHDHGLIPIISGLYLDRMKTKGEAIPAGQLWVDLGGLTSGYALTSKELISWPEASYEDIKRQIIAHANGCNLNGQGFRRGWTMIDLARSGDVASAAPKARVDKMLEKAVPGCGDRDLLTRMLGGTNPAFEDVIQKCRFVGLEIKASTNPAEPAKHVEG